MRARAKVTIDSLKQVDWYQNEWPWPLFVGRLTSREPLRHIRRWIPGISETVGDRGLAPKDHQQEMVYVESDGHVTSRDPERLNSWPQYLENS